MRAGKPRRGAASLTLLAVATLLLVSQSAAAGSEAGIARSASAYGQLPLSFVANRGQTDSRAAFVAHGKGYTLFLSPTETVFVAQAPTFEDQGAPRLRALGGSWAGGAQPSERAGQTAVRMQLLGADPSSVMVGEEQTSIVNYLVGDDRSKWLTDVPAYGKVRTRGVYPGVDLVFYGNRRHFEYDFVVGPGADPRSIRLVFDGLAEGQRSPALHIDSHGDLVLRASHGDLRLHRPVAYQDIDGVRREIAARYVVRTAPAVTGGPRPEIGVDVVAYDTNRPLVIDPVLDYATYLGGSGSDAGMAIAVDGAGHAYVAGFTESPDFPATTGASPSGGTRKAFVAKLNATGSALLYATFLGGNGNDTATGIGVDTAGNAYVTGLTESTNFPTVNAYQTNQAGTDVFVTKLDPSGANVLYSTYLGGAGTDVGLGIAVDGTGQIYVTGYTDSADFPRRNAFQKPGGDADAFVAKLNPSPPGTASLIYSTLLGGAERDEGHAIAVDLQGYAYVTGFTDSAMYPTQSAYKKDQPGRDAFVTKLAPLGNALSFSTYLGGSGTDVGLGIAVDAAGMVYVTGYTDSTDFPKKTPYQSSLRGATDAFVTTFDGTGALAYSTYLGGTEGDAGLSIAMAADNRVYVTGYTDSTDFPAIAGVQTGGRDAFVATFQPSGGGSPLVYATRVGGGGRDEAYGIALDTEGNAYITGLTQSPDFPVVGAFAMTLGGSQDAFVAKVLEPVMGADLVVSALSAAAGSGSSVTVTDSTKNQGNLAVATVVTKFYLSSDTILDAADVLLGSRTIAGLEPGQASSAATTLSIPATVAAGAHFIIAKADPDGAITETNEENNTASTPFTVGPDLTVSGLAVSAQGAAGAPVIATEVTANQGARAAVASTTKFYLSQDTALGASDIVLGSRAIAVLAPGATSPGSTTLTIPAGTAPGVYFVVAKADADDANAESNEGNNMVASGQIGIGPDLIVSSLFAPTTAGPGSPMVVSNTIKNQGAGPAGASTVKFYLSANATLDGTDTLLGSRAVGALAPGAISTESTSLTIPASATIGTYVVIAVADADNTVAEASEDNNTAVSTSVAIGADLVVTSVSLPSAAAPGAVVTVADITKNQSSAAAPASTTRFYLSADTVLDGGDTILGSRPVPALDAGAQSVGSTGLMIPSTVSGLFYVIARANADGAVTESDTANNTAVSALVKIGADLVVASLSAPDTAGPGAIIAVTETTKNLGAVGAPASTTSFYLSANNVFDASDVLLGSRAIPALAAGGASTATTSLTLPSGTPPGSYFLIARADAGNAIPELDETNNTAARALGVGADLVVTQVTIPPHAGAGASIAVSDTTRNESEGAAAASTTSFYLSSDATLDASAAFLGSRPVPALAGLASSTATTTLTIPMGTLPGRYYVIAVADGPGAMAEANKGNNARAAGSFKIGPDLSVDVLAAPVGASQGATISVTDTIINRGGGAAGPFVVTFFLSTDAVLDGGDTFLGSRAVPGVAGGPPWATQSGTTDLAIPAGLTGGNYYLIAAVDTDNAVPEQDETNNVHARGILIGADLVVWLDLPAASIFGAPGSPITVTDVTHNQSSVAVEASTTSFYLSSDTTLDASDTLLGSRVVPPLGPGQESTATNTLLLPSGIGGDYYIIARANAGAAIAEMNESNNVAVTNRTVRIGGDLIVFLDAPGAASPGEEGTPLAVTDTTRNDGAVASVASTTTFYLSADGTVDPGDVLLGSRAVPALAPGEASTVTTTFTVPAWLSGVYRVLAQSDADHTVTGLVLKGTEVQVAVDTPIAPPGPGPTVVVTDSTKNDGATAVGASTTSFFLSIDGWVDDGDILLGSRAVPALAPGEVSTGSTTLTIPAGVVGTYRIIAQSDLGNLVTSIAVEGANLLVASEGGGISSAPGSTITVTDYTKNEASVPVGTSSTAFYLSTDPVLDAGDVLLGSRAVPALAAGETSVAATALTLPANAFGTLYIIAQANAQNPVPEYDSTNNTAARTILVGADLIVRSVSAPSKAGAGMTIPVTDVTVNLSAAAAGPTTTRFYLSTNGKWDPSDVLLGSRAVPALTAGSNQATTTVTIPASTPTGKYYVLAVADATNSVTEADETNNVTASASIKIGPDLALDALGAPAGAGGGQTITVTDTIVNRSPATAGPSTVMFYFSTDATLDASDPLIGSRSVPSLSGGYPFPANSGSTAVTLPAAVPPGTRYIIAKVDAGDVVAEIHEDNNVRARPIQIGPDLMVTLDLAGSSSPPGSITVADQTKNDSSASAGPSTTAFYLSADTTLDPSDVLLGSRAVPALGPGATSSAVTTLTPPPGTVGAYYIIAKADADNAVPEANEDNNIAVTAATVRLGGDLIVWIDVPGGVANSAAGATVTVTDWTRSDNSAPVGPTTTRFFLVTGTTIDANAIALGSRAIPALGPSTTNTGTTTLTLPATASGTYRILARADADDVVVEANETNNVSAPSTPFTLGPDLVAWLDVPAAAATPAAESTITVTVQTRNDAATAAPGTTTKLYYSAVGTLDGSAVVVGSRAVPALGPGVIDTGTITFTLPAGQVGVRYLFAKADADGAVVESNEGNNVSAGKSITIGGDLIVWIDVGGGVANSAAGATVTVTDWTRSDNSAPVGPSTTRYYLVTGTTLDGSAVALGSRAIPALGPSTTNTGTTTLTLPATASGTYRIVAKADADGVVVEANKANNVSAASMAFTIGPDLVAWLDVPAAAATPAAESMIAVAVQTRNDAATAAPGTTTKLYYSAVGTLDGSAVVVGSRAVPALGPGVIDTGTITFTLPAGQVGVRYLFAKADADGAVVESNEGNNVSAGKSITIGGDLIVWIDVGGGVANSAAGATVTVTDWTRSDNSAPVGPSTTRYYLVTGTTLDGSAVALGSRAIPALGPSTTNTGTTTLTLPATASGTYRIVAKADADGVVVEANKANNVSAASMAFTIGPDLVAWLDVPAAAATPAAESMIAVAVQTRNDAATAAPGTTTKLYYSAVGTLDGSAVVVGSRAVPALGPGVIDTGTITFTLPAGQVGVRYLFAKADADGAVVESNEGNNVSAGKSITIGGDLIVWIDVGGGVANSAAGATVTVTDWTRSDNSAPVGPSTTRYYLVTGTTLDGSAVALGSRAIPALGPSTTNTGTTTLTLPATASGTYRIVAKADADGVVVEANKANNVSAPSAPFILGPDLLVYLDLPGVYSQVAAGSTMSITDTTKNNGIGAVGVSLTRFYLSADATLDAGDVPLGSRPVPALASGASSTGSTPLTLPTGIAGTYYIIAVADSENVAAEVNKTNNVTVSSPFEVGADLRITGTTVPAASGAGATLYISDVTKNRGGAPASASTTSIYLSADAVLDSGDLLLGSRAIPSLSAGIYSAGTTPVVIPAATPAGSYFIIVVADAGHAIRESNEGNNAWTNPIQILPDLSVTILSANSKAFPGATIVVTDTTVNQGAASGPSTTSVYLSTDATLDVGDRLLGARTVPALALGEASTGSISAAIPADTPGGAYYLIARSDSAGVIAEVDETNNTRVKTLTIGPELTVSALSAPSSAAVGATIIATDTTLNQGSAATPTTTKFYLSVGTVKAAGDPEIGNRSVPALALGATSTASTPLSIPAGTAPGSYYVIAECDATNLVAELTETNNTRARAITITP